VIRSAGPFHYRDTCVLKTVGGVSSYLDVSDHPSFTIKALGVVLTLQLLITAIVNSGIFPENF